MALVRANEIRAGYLSSVEQTSFVFTDSRAPFDFLVAVNANGRTAIALGQEGGFRGFECSDNTVYGGIIIPSPCFDLDLDHLGDPYESVAGDLIRHDDVLSISTKHERFAGFAGGLIEIVGGLPTSEGMRAVFSAWEISIGSAHDRQVLFRWDRASTNGVN